MCSCGRTHFKDLVAFAQTDADRDNVPPDFTTYTITELMEVFGRWDTLSRLPQTYPRGQEARWKDHRWWVLQYVASDDLFRAIGSITRKTPAIILSVEPSTVTIRLATIYHDQKQLTCFC